MAVGLWALAFLLRGYGQIGPRIYDETWSWAVLHDPLLLLVETHPPGYYLLFLLYHWLVGDAQGWGLLHAALSALVAPLVWRLAGVYPALLVAVAPALVQDGSFSRMYGPLDVAAAGLLLGLRQGWIRWQLLAGLGLLSLHSIGWVLLGTALPWVYRAFLPHLSVLPLVFAYEVWRLGMVTVYHNHITPAWGDTARITLLTDSPWLALPLGALALYGLPRAEVWRFLPLLTLLPLALFGYAKTQYVGVASLGVVLLVDAGIRRLGGRWAPLVATVVLVAVGWAGWKQAHAFFQQRVEVETRLLTDPPSSTSFAPIAFTLRLMGYSGPLRVCH